MEMVKIPFTTQSMGYDKDQVDGYIQKLSQEYDKMQTAYTDLTGQYDLLARSQPNTNMRAISRALVTAETTAMQIVENAKAEASRIRNEAYAEVGQLRKEKECFTAEIAEMVKGLKAILPAGE